MTPESIVLQSFFKSFNNSNFICLLSSSLFPLSFAEDQLVFSLGCYDLINSITENSLERKSASISSF